MTITSKESKPLNVHLDELVRKIRGDLLSTSSYLFSMKIAGTVEIRPYDSRKYLNFPKVVESISKFYTSYDFTKCCFLEKPYYDCNLILVDKDNRKYGVNLSSRKNCLVVLKMSESSGVYLTLDADRFRSIARSLLEDFEHINTIIQEEMTEINTVLDEIISRKDIQSQTVFVENGSLLDGMYVNLSKIGEGQNGSVWKAYQPKLSRDVAIKVLHPGFAGDSRLTEFYAEIRSQGKLLIHKNIVPIFSVHDVASPPFYVMELIDGKSLEKVIQEQVVKKEWISIERSSEIIKECLVGLSHAHDNGILHGDIKPANIMITKNGDIKLSDFGCSRFLDKSSMQFQTDSPTYSSMRASETYAAPEILRTEEVEESNYSSDLFSLGIVMYVLYTGAHPFMHPSGLVEIKDLIMQENFKANPIKDREPEIPDGKAALILSLLEKNNEEREFRTASELLKVWTN